MTHLDRLDRIEESAGQAGPLTPAESAATLGGGEGQPLRDQIYRQLQGLLVRGEYGPGQRLPERAIAERFGVSRGPVRDAIRLLERDGWVSLAPGRGSFVRSLSSKEIDDLYEARTLVESASARLAAIRAPAGGHPELTAIVTEAMNLLGTTGAEPMLSELTMQFHHEVSELADNTFLIEFSHRIRSISHRVVADLTPAIAPEAWTEHQAIAEAINTGNPILAEDLMRRHLEWSRRVYRQRRRART